MYVPWYWLLLILIGGTFTAIHMAILFWIALIATFWNRLLLTNEVEWTTYIRWDAYWSWEPWFNAGIIHGTVFVLAIGWYAFSRTMVRRVRDKRKWDPSKAPPL